MNMCNVENMNHSRANHMDMKISLNRLGITNCVTGSTDGGGSGSDVIELSINKQSVTSTCVIVYKSPWRIQRFNKEVSMQIKILSVILNYH